MKPARRFINPSFKRGGVDCSSRGLDQAVSSSFAALKKI